MKSKEILLYNIRQCLPLNLYSVYRSHIIAVIIYSISDSLHQTHTLTKCIVHYLLHLISLQRKALATPSRDVDTRKQMNRTEIPMPITFLHPGSDIIKLFSCSTELSMKFFLLINVKMPIIVGILTSMPRKNSILGFSETEKCRISLYFHTYEQLKFYAQLS